MTLVSFNIFGSSFTPLLSNVLIQDGTGIFNDFFTLQVTLDTVNGPGVPIPGTSQGLVALGLNAGAFPGTMFSSAAFPTNLNVFARAIGAGAPTQFAETNANVIVTKPWAPSIDGAFSNLASDGLNHQQVADKFQLSEVKSLGAISWFGRYSQAYSATNPVGFTVRFFADMGGRPVASPIAAFNVTAVAQPTGATYQGIPWFSYAAPLHLTLNPGTYWVSILESDPQTPAVGNSQWPWGSSNTVGDFAFRVHDGEAWTQSQRNSFAYTLSGTVGSPVTSLVAAVLPSSRSVRLGTTATAFVTVINAGGASAFGVGISLNTPIPANIDFRPTDPLTNQVIGALNVPVDIAAGASQTFVIGITPTAPFGPIEIALNFAGINTALVNPLIGVNTLLLSASTTPVPDIVTMAATLNNDGIVNIPGNSATGVFAVATVNIGASGNITASADTGGTTLPVNLSLCQTNPTTGACLAPPASSVTTTINAGATPTFGIFVQGTGNVVFNPATKRIFTRFKDNGGVTRGSTSVAVRTVTVPGSFAGTYSGTFTGDDSGTWNVIVDSSGSLTGSGFSQDIGNFGVTGNVTASGAVFFTVGTVTTGASFSGIISTSGVVSDTWVNTFFGVSGTFSGSKQ